MLEMSGSAFAAPMMEPNDTRFGGWLLNTDDNWFGPDLFGLASRFQHGDEGSSSRAA